MTNVFFFKARTVTRDGMKMQLAPRTEEDVLGDLPKFLSTHGRLPTYADFRKALAHGESFPAKTMCRHFGCTWTELLGKAGLKAMRKRIVRKSNEDMLEDLRTLYCELKRPLIKSDINRPGYASPSSYMRRFGSVARACCLAAVPCVTGQDAHLMLAVVVDFIEEFGRAPTAKEFERSGVYHGNLSAATYATKFRSWRNVVDTAQRYLRERRP